MSTVRNLPLTACVLLVAALAAPGATGYPPAVGILTRSKDCLACHVANGPWTDEARTIVDVLDATTKKSLRAPDGSFLLEVMRGEPRTVLTVIGRAKGESQPPRRIGWLYVDPSTIESSSLSKFAPGWDVNLPGACRLVGDTLEGFGGAALTALPMTVRPADSARDAELVLQVMLTTGDSVKGKPKEGMVANYLTRKLVLKVLERPTAAK